MSSRTMVGITHKRPRYYHGSEVFFCPESNIAEGLHAPFAVTAAKASTAGAKPNPAVQSLLQSGHERARSID